MSGLNNPLTQTRFNLQEGLLVRSADKHTVTLAGYAAAPAYDGPANKTADVVARVVGRVDAAGNVDTSTLITNAFSSSAVQCASTNDGTSFWVSGLNILTSPTEGGVQFVGLGSTGTSRSVVSDLPSTISNFVFDGRLYTLTAQATKAGLRTIGTGLPTSSSTSDFVPGFTTVGVGRYQVAMVDRTDAIPGVDTIYVSLTSGANAGVERWDLDPATSQWKFTRALQGGLTGTGIHGLTAYVSGGSVVLVGTTTPKTTAQTRLVVGVDDGSATVSFTTLATAPINTEFRGVALPPI